jgi:glycosyltransferase involved in cell wall biosynthesis
MGGMERAASNTANGLLSLGNEVIFLTIFKKPHFFLLHNDIRIIEPIGFNQTSLNNLKTVFWIRQQIENTNPTTILVFNKFYGALTALSLIKIKIPFYISERSSPFFSWRFPLNFINKVGYYLNPPTGVMAQTEIAAQYQRKYFPHSKLEVIPNSIRTVKLYPNVKREQIILAVGRMNDYLKGFDLLIEALAKIKNQHWELHFAGGEKEDGLEIIEQASSLGLLHRIRFLGKIKDLDPIYAKAGIFVIPSRSEGFPNALAEAMAAGCCCVAFDFIAGASDIIKHNLNGLIVENGNIIALAECIDDLILDEQKRILLGQNALEIELSLNINTITHRINSFLIS